jgi:hypothetical protein
LLAGKLEESASDYYPGAMLTEKGKKTTDMLIYL